MRAHIPLLGQLRDYDGDRLKGDLTAGLTVGVMLIPQGMAYALIAGLPPIYGLYASLMPLIVYAFLGTSRQLAVGPVAMVSLLVAAGVGPIAAGPEEYIALTLLLTLMVGLIQFILGMARFGFLVNFLSHPVLAGFTSAAALIIGFSQLNHLLGISIDRSHFVHDIIASAAAQAGTIHLPTLLIGLASIAALVLVRRWRRSFPGALLVVGAATLVTAVWGLETMGVRVVGTVPEGLPGFIVPSVSLEHVLALLPTALVISLVGFMESIAVAKVYASRGRYRLDANQELIGLGLANVVGAFFRAYPTTGGFSRTAVNAEAGAQTNAAAVVSAAIIALTLLVLTPLFYYLPNAVLAAIVMVAVSGLFDWKEMAFLWKVDRRDLTLLLITFAATLALGIEQGILVGVVASLVSVVHQSVRPHTAVMGRLPGTMTYRNVDRHPEALVTSGTVILRMDASYYFANTDYLKERLGEIARPDHDVKALVIDAYPVNTIDSTAAHALRESLLELRRRGVGVYFAGVKGPVFDVLERAGIADLIGREHFFYEVHEAVEAADTFFDSSSDQPQQKEEPTHVE
ncbi:MAG: solute carrier family 26 protein [Rhodothermales bacterium]